MSLTRRQLRHTAYVTLFAWVFGLLSGAANACLIQPNPAAEFGFIASRTGAEAGDAAGPATQPVRHVHHRGEDEDTGDGLVDDTAKAGCLKFCAEETSVVTKSKAGPAEALGPVSVFSGQWQLAPPVAGALEWTPVERPATVGPPLFIRLLRLTI
jgi:hypothetical protein